MKKLIIVVAICLSRGSGLFAQTDTTGAVFQQLGLLENIYNNFPSLSFFAVFNVHDSLSPADVTNLKLINYKLSYGRALISDTVTEVLVGKDLNVVVDKYDSTINLVPRQGELSLIQLPVLDSAFRADHVSGAKAVYTSSDSLCTINVYFKPESPYLRYQLVYHTNDYHLESIDIKVRDELGQYPGVTPGHVAEIMYLFTTYSSTALEPSDFNEARYVYQLNGQYYLQQAWQAFQLQTP